MAPCISAAMACNDFLQTSGKWPASLTMPPAWPPIPSAHVLQAFLLRIARQSLSKPPTSRALRRVYQTAGQPPPVLTFRTIVYPPSRMHVFKPHFDPRLHMQQPRSHQLVLRLGLFDD